MIRVDISDMFREAQERIFTNGHGDIHAMGLTKDEAMYGDGNFLSSLDDICQPEIKSKMHGIDTGGTLALHNMFDQSHEPKTPVCKYFNITRR